MPDHPVLLSLLRQFDMAVAAPSANPYQKLSPTSAEQVLRGLDGKIAAVLDGGRCGIGTESTILRVSDDKAEILRSGPLSAADLQPYLPVPVLMPQRHHEAVSGNKKVHYQPDAKVMICSTSDIEAQLVAAPDGAGVLVYSSALHRIQSPYRLILPDDHHGYRQALYASLYALDSRGVKRILVEAPPHHPAWADIRDRLYRAAAE